MVSLAAFEAEQLLNMEDELRKAKTSKLYYEAHITIEPVFDDRLTLLKNIAEAYSYRVADLLMQKRVADTAQRSKFDTFMTTRDKDWDVIVTNTKNLVLELQERGYKVWRYKIEDTIVDSQLNDEFELKVGRQ